MRKSIMRVGTCIAFSLAVLSAPAAAVQPESGAAQSVPAAVAAPSEQFPEPLVIILVALAGLVLVARRYGGRDPRDVEQELERHRRKAADRPEPPRHVQLP